MRALLLLLALTSFTFINAQREEIKVNLSLDDKCGFKTIMLQSVVSSEVVQLDAQIKEHALSIFSPTDIFIVNATGESTTDFVFNVVVEEFLNISTGSKAGCNTLLIESPGAKRTEALNEYKNLNKDQQEKQLVSYIQQNANSIAIKDYLQEYLNSDFMSEALSKAIIKTLAESAHPILSHQHITPFLSSLKQSIHQDAKPFQVSDKKLISYGSEKFNLPSAENEYLVIDFWYTSCAPCVRNHKKMKEEIVRNEFPQNLDMAGISIETDEARWRAFLDKNQAPWDNYLLKPNEKELIGEYGIIAYPTYLLLDKEGIIIDRLNSYEQLKAKMETLHD